MDLLLRCVVGDIVGQVQGRHGVQIVLHPGGIQGDLVSTPLGEVDIIAPIGVGGVALLIDGGIVVGAGDTQLGDGIQIGDLVILDQLAELGVKEVQGVVFHQVHVAVPDGDIALGVHGAVIPQEDGVVRILCGDVDGAGGIAQPVLAQILRVLDDKGGAEGGKGIQQFGDLVLIHREGVVAVIGPGAVLLAEGQGLAVILPGEVGDGVRGELQNHLAAVLDVLLAGFVPGDAESHKTRHHQHARQDIELFIPVHSEASFF